MNATPITAYNVQLMNTLNKSVYILTHDGYAYELCPAQLCTFQPGIFLHRQSAGANFYMPSMVTTIVQVPEENRPTYVPELNVVLFATAEELNTVMNSYGNHGGDYVKDQSVNLLDLESGSYIFVTSLNANDDFYTLVNGSVTMIPRVSDDRIHELMDQYRITKQQLDVSYVFLINQVTRSDVARDLSSPTFHRSVELKIIPKNKVIATEPIFFTKNGFIVFQNKDQADSFIDEYGTIENYWIQHAVAVTEDAHQQQIDELNEAVRKDKQGIVEMFALMGGTSIVSVVAEAALNSYMNNNGRSKTANEKTKKATIALCAVVTGVGVVFGSYKLIKNHLEKKRKRERLGY